MAPAVITLDDLAKPLIVADSQTKTLDALASELHVLEVGRKRAEVLRFMLETWVQFAFILVLVSFFLFLNVKAMDLIKDAHSQDNALMRDYLHAAPFAVKAGTRSVATDLTKKEEDVSKSITRTKKDEEVSNGLDPEIKKRIDSILKNGDPQSTNAAAQVINAGTDISSWPSRVISDSVIISLITALLVQVGGGIAVMIGYLYRKPTDSNSAAS